MVRWWLSSVCLLGLWLAAACGGGGEEGSPTAAAPSPGAGRPTPVLQRTPEATPIIIDGDFRAPTKGYGVHIPDGWIARPNLLPTATSISDVFFAPEEEGPVRTNIAVTCETVDGGMTLKQYVDQHRELVAVVTGQTPEVEEAQVAGVEAARLAYALEKEPAVDKLETVFAGKDCIWVVSLTAPLGQGATERTVFDEFVSSFTFLP
jgi:hypothetical protein